MFEPELTIPPLTMTSFAKKIASSAHTITLEISPPKGTDVSRFLDRVRPLKDRVDAINVPDCQRSILKMSSMAASKLIQDEIGIETVWQLTTRDRNMIALQSDLLGGWALGLKNVLAITGDPVAIGDQGDVARQVSHLDALRLMELIRVMNRGKDATGKEFKQGGTDFCYGGALNPHRMSREAQKHRVLHKLNLGVQFFQTQPVYNLPPLEEANELIDTLCSQNHLKRPKILVGIIPPKSAKFARFMNQNVPGIEIPQSFIDILDRSDNPIQESIKFSADLVQELAPHAGGFHIMPVTMEKYAPDILDAFFAKGSRIKRLKAV